MVVRAARGTQGRRLPGAGGVNVARPDVLWGVHPAHGSLPLKIAEWSASEQRRREGEGWTCERVSAGKAPTTLHAPPPPVEYHRDLFQTYPGGRLFPGIED